VASPHKFDFHPSVILMRGEGPFVISTDSQRDLVAKLNLKSLLYIWGGPAAALWVSGRFSTTQDYCDP